MITLNHLHCVRSNLAFTMLHFEEEARQVYLYSIFHPQRKVFFPFTEKDRVRVAKQNFTLETEQRVLQILEI